MLIKLALYAVVSNFLLFLYVSNILISESDFFLRVNELVNPSSIGLLISGNTLIANFGFLWTVVTLFFFGSLSVEEVLAVKNNCWQYVLEFTVPLLYGEKFFSLYNIGVICCCIMLCLWSHISDTRLQHLSIMDSGVRRLCKVLQFAFFLVGVSEVLVILLTHLWNAQQDESSPISSLHSYICLRFGLLLLSFVKYSLCLAGQECNRTFFGSFRNGWDMFYARKAFCFLESFLFSAAVAHLFFAGSGLPFFMWQQVISNVKSLFQTPLGMYKYYKVSSRLRRMPQATAEELEREEVVCTICLDRIVSTGGARRLACSHIFHESCLRQWLEDHITCPYCRKDILHSPMVNPVDAAPPPEDVPPTEVLRSNSEIQEAFEEYLRTFREENERFFDTHFSTARRTSGSSDDERASGERGSNPFAGSESSEKGEMTEEIVRTVSPLPRGCTGTEVDIKCEIAEMPSGLRRSVAEVVETEKLSCSDSQRCHSSREAQPSIPELDAHPSTAATMEEENGAAYELEEGTKANMLPSKLTDESSSLLQVSSFDAIQDTSEFTEESLLARFPNHDPVYVQSQYRRLQEAKQNYENNVRAAREELNRIICQLDSEMGGSLES